MRTTTGAPSAILLTVLLFSLAPLPTLADHGHQVPLSDPSDDWATRHMAEEHHIANLDPPSFFTLHDFNSDNVWSPDEIRRSYGMDDRDSKEVKDLREQGDEAVRLKGKEIVDGVLAIFDADGDGVVQREEFVEGWHKQGKRLLDYGMGPGHHGDDEYEYEIHHFERFHDESEWAFLFSLISGRHRNPSMRGD